MTENPTAVRIVLTYMEAAQQARRSGGDEDWQRVAELLADDVVMQAAGGRTEPVWRELRGRTALMDVLREPRNTWSRLQTATINAFGDDEQVLIEQISTEVADSGAQQTTPAAFIFSVANGRVTRIRRYGAGSPPEPPGGAS